MRGRGDDPDIAGVDAGLAVGPDHVGDGVCLRWVRVPGASAVGVDERDAVAEVRGECLGRHAVEVVDPLGRHRTACGS